MCMLECVCELVGACVRVYVCACMCMCVRVGMCFCVHVRVCERRVSGVPVYIMIGT